MISDEDLRIKFSEEEAFAKQWATALLDSYTRKSCKYLFVHCPERGYERLHLVDRKNKIWTGSRITSIIEAIEFDIKIFCCLYKKEELKFEWRDCCPPEIPHENCPVFSSRMPPELRALWEPK